MADSVSVSAETKSRRKAPPPRVKVVAKSDNAYKTIAEVAAELGVATHVLRFWEGKFPQIQPLKQRGGRRFYRPDDVRMLVFIKAMLYERGMTIRGVQNELKKTGKSELKAVVGTMSLPKVRQELVQIAQMLENGR